MPSSLHKRTTRISPLEHAYFQSTSFKGTQQRCLAIVASLAPYALFHCHEQTGRSLFCDRQPVCTECAKKKKKEKKRKAQKFAFLHLVQTLVLRNRSAVPIQNTFLLKRERQQIFEIPSAQPLGEHRTKHNPDNTQLGPLDCYCTIKPHLPTDVTGKGKPWFAPQRAGQAARLKGHFSWWPIQTKSCLLGFKNASTVERPHSMIQLKYAHVFTQRVKGPWGLHETPLRAAQKWLFCGHTHVTCRVMHSRDKQKQDQWHYSEVTINTLRLEAWHARSWRCYICWSRVKYCRSKPSSAVVQARDLHFKLSTMTRNCLTKVTEQIPSLLLPKRGPTESKAIAAHTAA